MVVGWKLSVVYEFSGGNDDIKTKISQGIRKRRRNEYSEKRALLAFFQQSIPLTIIIVIAIESLIQYKFILHSGQHNI